MQLWTAIKVIGGTGAALYAYTRYGRGRVRDWGARPDEATMALPGDDILPNACLQTTRAISIDTAPEHVWPWIVQMGGGKRAGAYTYDWIERLLGIDIRNADRILPEFQHLEPGDYLALNDKGTGIVVREVHPGNSLVVQWQPAGSTWTFALHPDGDGSRLLSRNRLTGSGPAFWIMAAIMEPLSLVMERKMLLGIKQRAEKLSRDASALLPAGHHEVTWLERGAD